MEQASPPLLPPTCVLCLEKPHVAAACNHHHFPRFRTCARASHGLHYKEIQRLRLLCHDVADAHRHGSKEQVGPRPNPVEQRAVLVQHDLGVEYGKSSHWICL
jgi:hypothetical protein